jgi:hypothetical protein
VRGCNPIQLSRVWRQKARQSVPFVEVSGRLERRWRGAPIHGSAQACARLLGDYLPWAMAVRM